MKTTFRSLVAWFSPAAWLRDLLFAARGLRRTPAFSLAVFGTLALCLGPNAAILAVLHALVLKPLPFPEPRQLCTVVNVAEKSGRQLMRSSTTQYLDFCSHADLFAGFATLRRDGATLDEDVASSRVVLDLVSPEFFEVLGVEPVRGRRFAADDFAAGRDSVVIVGHEFWRDHYASDGELVGRSVRIGGELHTIVGVAPRSLTALDRKTSFLKPYVPAASKLDPQSRYRGDLTLYARLRPGVSPEAGRAQLAALEESFRTQRATPAVQGFIADAGFRLALEPLRGGGAVSELNSLWLLQGGAVLVLLIGAVNVGNLFLARLNAKRGELAVRAALGAGRGVLARQILAESLLLTVTGTAAGLVLGATALEVFNRYLPLIVPGALPVRLEATATSAIIVVAGALAFLIATVAWRWVSRGGLRLGDLRTARATGGTRLLGHALVTAQVAIAVLLLVGAGLLLRSFSKVLAVDPGFDPSRVVQARVAVPTRYRDAAAKVALQRRIVDELYKIPGVEQVSLTLDAVLDANVRPVPFATRDSAASDGEGQRLIHIATVSPDFFRTLGLSVVAGRGFNSADDFATRPVVVVSQSFAERHFPGRAVEGQEIHLSRGLPLATESWARIVGVVNRAQFTGLDSRDDLPTVFVPLIGYPAGAFQVLVRSPRPTADVLREMRAKLREIDPTIPLYSESSLEQRLADMLLSRRGITWLLGVFAGLALLLATVGLYGVLAYDVGQRTREIGIRGALGATRGRIVAMVLRRGMGRVAVGLALGCVGALFLTRLLESLLFGVKSGDALSFLAVLGLCAFASLLACWLPARQAAKVQPIEALRAE